MCVCVVISKGPDFLFLFYFFLFYFSEKKENFIIKFVNEKREKQEEN